MPDAFLVGLLGNNILRSLSPAMHEDGFAAAGVRGYYHLMDLEVMQRPLGRWSLTWHAWASPGST